MSRKRNPPKHPVSWLLRKIASSPPRLSIIGDIKEEYAEHLNKKGRIPAAAWYFRQILGFLPSIIIERLYWGSLMFKNYLKTAVRNLFRQKIQAAVNILGLSLGLTVCFFIYLLIHQEFSFDRFHAKADRIFAVTEFDYKMGFPGTVGPTMGMAPLMEEFFPEIEHVIRMHSFDVEAAVLHDDKMFQETPILTDPEFFQTFSFPLLYGDAETALDSLDDMIMTQRTATKYFGEKNPVGETLTVIFGDRKKEFTVSGVTRDIPENSSILFNILIRVENISIIHGPEYLLNLDRFCTRTFALLKSGASPEAVNLRFPAFVRQYMGSELESRRRDGMTDSQGRAFDFYLHNIKDIHLEPNVRGNPRTSDIRQSWLLGGIAVLILIIACINFVNISIGRSASRRVEIGIRKVLGAGRKQLIHQFWSESILTMLSAGILAAVTTSLSLPLFSRLAQRQLSAAPLFYPRSLLILALFILLAGSAAGAFPSLFMSKLRTVEIFRGKLKFSGKHIFSKFMIIFQFSLSVFLIVSTLVMTRQIRFITHQNLGFDREGVMIIRSQERTHRLSEQTLVRFKEQAQILDDVLSISGSWATFGRHLSYAHMMIKGENTLVHINKVHYDYLDTLGIKLLEGRDFSPDIPSDSRAAIVNRSYLEKMELNSPIGSPHHFSGDDFPPMTIIGVTEDYHYQSLKSEIEPTVLFLGPEVEMPSLYHILVRFKADRVAEIIPKLERIWGEVQPEKPFLYSFLDSDVERVYTNQQRWNEIVRISSALAILITCMGIFGLTLISLSRRIKEIGIRKVLGASIPQIFSIVAGEFILLVLIANLASLPLSYLIMRHWLNGFAYRTAIGPFVFAAALGISVVITLLTISGQSLKAALSNPVDSIRYE